MRYVLKREEGHAVVGYEIGKFRFMKTGKSWFVNIVVNEWNK